MNKCSFADFHQALKGYDVMRKKSDSEDEKVVKWSVYHSMNQDDINLLIKDEHQYYYLTDRPGWKNGEITDELFRRQLEEDSLTSETA